MRNLLEQPCYRTPLNKVRVRFMVPKVNSTKFLELISYENINMRILSGSEQRLIFSDNLLKTKFFIISKYQTYDNIKLVME